MLYRSFHLLPRGSSLPNKCSKFSMMQTLNLAAEFKCGVVFKSKKAGFAFLANLVDCHLRAQLNNARLSNLCNREPHARLPAQDPNVNGQVIKGFFSLSFTSFFRCAISLSTGLTLLACTDE